MEKRRNIDIASGLLALLITAGAIETKNENQKNEYSLDEVLTRFAPPTATERIPVAKSFIRELRLLSDKYDQGEIAKTELVEEIFNLRTTLQKGYGTKWI